MRRGVYPGKFRWGVKCAPALENPAPEPPAPLPPRIAAQGPRDRPRSAAAQLRRRDQPPQAGYVARISSAPAGQADRPAGRSARTGPGSEISRPRRTAPAAPGGPRRTACQDRKRPTPERIAAAGAQARKDRPRPTQDRPSGTGRRPDRLHGSIH